MPPKIAFVAADETGRTTATDRKLIRSHCMLGKNQRKYPYQGSRDHRNGKKKQVTELRPETSLVASDSPSTAQYTLPSPRGTPSVFSLATFAREIDSFSRLLLYRYFFVARDVFYPVQFCTYSDASVLTWFEWLLRDTAYLECALMGMSAMDDFLHGRFQPSKLTLSHLKATITALNNRLSDPDLCLADSTIAVVMGLAELSGFLSDEAAATAHLAGFQKMVRLRGGVGGFGDNTKLRIKIGRFDLAYALQSGQPPQFYMDPISWTPIFTPTEPTTSLGQFITSPKLLAIFHDLVQFTAILNASCSFSSHGPQPLLMDTQYSNLIGSIQYRLLCIGNELTTALDEVIRLGMVALLTTTFQVVGQRARYPHLEDRFRVTCKTVMLAGNDATESLDGDTGKPCDVVSITPDVVLWLILIGRLSVFNITRRKNPGNQVDGQVEQNEINGSVVNDRGWLAEAWRRHVPLEWQDDWQIAKEKQQGFPWIEAIHDQPAKTIFDLLCSEAKMGGGSARARDI